MQKRIVACAAGIAAMGLSTIASAAPYDDALNSVGNVTHRWSFEHASGDAIDSVGGVTLTAVNSPTTGVDAALNAKFMGLGAGNQATEINRGADDHYHGGSTSLANATEASMSFFFRREQNVGDVMLYAGLQRDVNSGRYLLAVRGDADDHLKALWRNSDTVAGETPDGSGHVEAEDGEWHHVVVTFSVSDDELNFYMDGSLMTTVGGLSAIGGNITEDMEFLIGADIWVDNRNYGGGMDEVVLFNKALSAGEVAQLYNAALVPEPASLALLGLGSLMMIRRRKA